MSAADKELESIANQVASLENKFVSGSSLGKYLQSEEQASFKRLVAEAISLLDSVLGEENNFSRNIAGTVNSGSGGFIGGPSYACVQETRGLIIGAANHIRRMENLNPKANQTNQSAYVDSGRLAELKALTSSKFDLSRLVRLCEELNMAHIKHLLDVNCYACPRNRRSYPPNSWATVLCSSSQQLFWDKIIQRFDATARHFPEERSRRSLAYPGSIS